MSKYLLCTYVLCTYEDPVTYEHMYLDTTAVFSGTTPRYSLNLFKEDIFLPTCFSRSASLLAKVPPSLHIDFFDFSTLSPSYILSYVLELPLSFKKNPTLFVYFHWNLERLLFA